MQVNYTVKGQGKKNILLLHGWGGSAKSLASLQDELVKVCKSRVYNIELPGFGDSKHIVDKPLGLDDYVAELDNFIRKQEIDNPVVAGHSFGGKIALAYAINKPDKLSSIILINSSGLKPKNSIKKIVFLIPTKIFGWIFSLPILRNIKKTVRKVYYRYIVRETDYLVSEAMQETLKNVLKVNLDDEVAKINTDTLLIWGEDDTYTPLWMGKKLDELIPNSRLEVVKGARHNLPLVNPETVASIISLFVR